MELNNSGFFDKIRDEDDQLYKIVRVYSPMMGNKEDELIAEHLTLEEAQEHCNDPSTAVAGVYFDSYRREN